MEYLEYICPIVCFAVCFLHSIIESVIMSKQNKKIDKICDKCFEPVVVGSEHQCDPALVDTIQFLQMHLKPNEISALIDICRLVNGDKNGDSE